MPLANGERWAQLCPWSPLAGLPQVGPLGLATKVLQRQSFSTLRLTSPESMHPNTVVYTHFHFNTVLEKLGTAHCF